jgi:hypothetical protein
VEIDDIKQACMYRAISTNFVILYIIQDYGVLYNNALPPAICKVCVENTCMTASFHYGGRGGRGRFVHIKQAYPVTFYLSACTKPEK